MNKIRVMENEKKEQIKSNGFKLVVVTILMTLVLIISLQNLRKVELDVLIWKWDIPLVLLLTGNSLAVAIITFILTKWKRSK